MNVVGEVEHTITALKQQKRDLRKVNVYLDGEYAFSLSRFVAAWLKVGQVLNDAKISGLQAENGHELAYQKALKFISYRHRSEVEIRRNLTTHKYPQEVIDVAIERLQNNGLVDDTQFAQNWVDNRNEFRPRSKKALEMELRTHGVNLETIHQAVDGLDEDELAYQAGLKQSRKYSELDWDSFRRKLTGFLARRGFNYETIAPVIGRIWTEKQSKGQVNVDTQ